MGKFFTAEDIYYMVLTFDDHVKRRHTHSQYTPSKPMGGSIARLPKEYKRWANGADPDDIDQFWNLIALRDFDGAQKVSKLPATTVAEIMASYGEDTRLTGKVAPDEYEWGGVRLTSVLYIFNMTPKRFRVWFERYANKRHGPPWNALPDSALRAFGHFANEINAALSEKENGRP